MINTLDEVGRNLKNKKKKKVDCQDGAATPPLHNRITKWDDLVRMDEEETIRRRSYRAATASREIRIKMLDDASAMFGVDFFTFNRKVEEASQKTENAILSHKTNTAVNSRLTQRIKIMRGLYLRLRLMATVMETKIKLYEDVIVIFLDHVARDMRLDSPLMVFNRHTTMCFMSQELQREQVEKENVLNDLKERHETFVKNATNERLVHINEMMQLNDRLEFARNEIIHQEAEITCAIASSTSTALIIYRLKNAIFFTLQKMQSHHGEVTEPTDVMKALDLIKYSFQNLSYAVDKIRALIVHMPKDQAHKTRTRKKKTPYGVKTRNLMRAFPTPGGSHESVNRNIASKTPNEDLGLPIIHEELNTNATPSTRYPRKNRIVQSGQLPRRAHRSLPILPPAIKGVL